MALRDVVRKVVDAPRHVSEKVEEVREHSAKAYHDKREEPARQAAQQHYEEKHMEAREKLKRGDISRELYEKRNAKYLKQRDAEAAPVEQRVATGATNVAKTFKKSATEVAEKVAASGGPLGKPGPQPKFKPGRGIPGTAPRKGKSAIRRTGGQPDFGRSTINFGGSQGFGGSTVDFGRSTLGGGGSMRMGDGGAIDFSAPIFGSKKIGRK